MKIKSGLATQWSGSVGGLTGSHNRGGMYLRARSIPTNPATALQQAVRAAMANLSQLWGNTLSAAQRTAWSTYADNVQIVDTLGDPRNVTGLNMYVRSNVPRLQAGLPRVDAAPTTFDLGNFTDPSFAIDEPNDEVDVSFDNSDDWANEDDAAMLVYSSTPQSPSIQYFTNPYQFSGKVDGDATTPPTSPGAFALPTAIATGQKAFFRVVVSRADGRLSTPFRGQANA